MFKRLKLMLQLKLKNQLYFLVIVTLTMYILYTLLYYSSFSLLTYNRAEETAEQMIGQVAQNVRNMTENIENSAEGLGFNKYVQEILVSQDPVRNIELYDYLTHLVSVAKESNNVIYSVSWTSDNLRRISDPIRDDNGVAGKLNDMYHYTDKDFVNPVFSSVVRGTNDSLYYFGYIFPVYSTSMSNIQKIGAGVFVLDIRELEKLVTINEITENSLFVILDQNNNVVTCNRDLQSGTVYQDIFWDVNSTEVTRDTIYYNDKKSIAQCMTVEENGWKIVSIIPMDELSSDMNYIVKISVILALISSITLLLIGHFIIKSITRPINTVVNFLQTETNSLKKRVEIPKQDEVAIIALNINEMLDRVENMTKKIVENQTLLYESKLAEQNAELLALQSQINPHFLYNTLNCMSNIGLAYDITEIEDISVAMSNIYRYSIKGDKMVCLSEEIQCINEYMRIMDIRFNGKFETEYRIDESLMKLYTLKMILQPIVENAVYHGMEQKKGKGKLIIEGKISEEDQLILSVHNDGKPIPPQQLVRLRKAIVNYESVGLYNSEKKSIGLSNINKRIKLQFGVQYGLSIESDEINGTRTTLILPVVRER